MANAIDILRANRGETPSRWKEQAQWHVDNWGWIKHSARIAISARSRMSELGLTQKELAERMGCSQQYVSLILKGKENLTLETISKLERVLDYEILSFPQTHGNGYGLPTSRPYAYLNDAEAPTYGNSDTTER